MNFRDNPLTLDITLEVRRRKSGNQEEREEEEEDDREMFGRDFMLMYIREARKRAHAALTIPRVNREWSSDVIMMSLLLSSSSSLLPSLP